MLKKNKKKLGSFLYLHGDILDRHADLLGHEAEDGEDGEPGREGGQAVAQTHHHSVPKQYLLVETCNLCFEVCCTRPESPSAHGNPISQWENQGMNLSSEIKDCTCVSPFYYFFHYAKSATSKWRKS